jgi:flagella basal body P-ring formation protein FlgA
MASSASSRLTAVLLGLAAFALALAAGALHAHAAGDAPGAAWAARIADAVAARRGVPAAALVLEWGALPDGGLPEDGALRVLGGTEGWYVAAIDGGSRTATLRVRAGVTDTVCVAARDLARGTTLAAGDMRLEPRVRWSARATNPARPGAGWELRRAVAAGSVLAPPTAAPPAVVHAGDRIEVWWTRGRVALRLDGTALAAARLGEPVRVRIDGRARALTAVVAAPGRATIGAPAQLPAANTEAS